MDREVSHIQTSIAELEKSLFKTPVEVDQICNLIGATVEKLQTMKRKVRLMRFIFVNVLLVYIRILIVWLQVEEAINDELDAAQNCKRRVEHLKVGAVGSSSVESTIGYSLWKKTRVERFLVDHLLRSGHYDTGTATVFTFDFKMSDIN